MTDGKLKPVSPLARKFLAALGETAEEHQKQVQSVLARKQLAGKTITKPNDTKEPVWKLNKETLAKLDATVPLSQLKVVREQDTLSKYTWVPEAYVLFVNRIFCKTCRTWNDSLERPDIFLRHRSSSANISQPKHYTPTRDLSLKLPRVRELRLDTSPVCLSCWNKSPQEAINASSKTLSNTVGTMKPKSNQPITNFTPQGFKYNWENLDLLQRLYRSYDPRLLPVVAGPLRTDFSKEL